MITQRDKQTGRIIRQHRVVIKLCKCGKMFTTSEDRLEVGRGLNCSKKCMYKYRPIKVKENHHQWRGSEVSYSGIHHWVKKYFGQPMTCEWCGFESDNKYQIHWANLDGNYDRLRENWARLCAKCHYHFDREGVRGDKS